MSKAVCAVLLLIGVMACGAGEVDPPQSAQPDSLVESPGGVSLEIDPSNPERGETVVLTLQNRGRSEIGYNLCTSALATETGDRWAPLPSDRVCTMELRVLRPGASDTFPIPLPADLDAGRYRFETSLELMDSGARTVVASEPFAIGG